MSMNRFQRKVFDAIAIHLAKGYSPSYQLIADSAGLNSVATVSMHLDSLEARGYIVRRRKWGTLLERACEIELTVLGKNALAPTPLLCPKCGHEMQARA